MEISNQKQQAGDNSTQMQGNNITNYITLKSASNLNGNLNCSKELEHYAS